MTVLAAVTGLPACLPSPVWQAHWRELEVIVMSDDSVTNVLPVRGTEDDRALWLEAPNAFVAEWITHHLTMIEQIIRPHTALPIRVCIG